MKLISLNVAIFIANNKKVTEFLNSQNADIVCLQEVTRGNDKVIKKYLSFDAVNKATENLPYAFFGGNNTFKKFYQEYFHGKKVFDFDFKGFIESGNYTKSKYEIKKGENIFLMNHFLYRTDFATWPEEDSRAVLVTDYDINGRNLRIINYHGIWTRHKKGHGKTLSANKKILEIAKKAEGEVIICGDFNLFPHTESMKVFEKDFISLVDSYNIKTTRPIANELNNENRNVVDYIFVSKGIKIKGFEIPGTDISDHLPLVLEFEI